MTVMGLGLGAIELGANGLMIQLHSADRGRFLNLLSVFHGCGSLVVPLVAAGLIDANWSWQAIYATCSLMALPLIVVFWPIRAVGSSSAGSVSVEPEQAVAAPHWLSIGFTPIMWRYYVLIAAYVATELSLGAWMMEYLQQQHQFTVDQSSRYLSAFFVMLMLGRLSGRMDCRTHELSRRSRGVFGSHGPVHRGRLADRQTPGVHVTGIGALHVDRFSHGHCFGIATTSNQQRHDHRITLCVQRFRRCLWTLDRRLDQPVVWFAKRLVHDAGLRCVGNFGFNQFAKTIGLGFFGCSFFCYSIFLSDDLTKN